eukprot:TRINITY_DN1568_c0_g1_i10.p1 TRINITY_DN1568_c0_g1~~TRINITY_DN1568_c0_g1_i10.p1  ORF type:complete len:565 (-),score=143.00 TRINITY_DN1568_c0_g1_i10:175-1869(-)
MLASYGSSRVQSQPAQARLTGFNATCSTRKIRVAVAASKKLQIQSPKQQFKKLLVHATAQSETPVANQQQSGDVGLSQIGLIGLAVMGQNLSLNIASKGFSISVYNRSYSKTEAAVQRAAKEGLATKLRGFEDIKDFVQSLERPRRVILLVKAGAPVDATIEQLLSVMEEGDIIIDGGNEWYENTERRAAMVEDKGLLYMGMGVSGGEEGARNGPSLMPGGSPEAYKFIQPIVEKVAAQVDDGPCVTYVGPGGAGNFVKMVHNGIEYGDMQLISEAYDILKTIGGLTNQELSAVFDEWNQGELESFLVEITGAIFDVKDDLGDGYLVDKVLDKTGSKGTGKWTVQQAADLGIAAPTITASLDGRYMSALKSERVAASAFYAKLGLDAPEQLSVDKTQLVDEVKQALLASKICSYAQGMNIIKAKSDQQGWDINLGEMARIWKGGCIIRAGFLGLIKEAYGRDAQLPNLLVDPYFGTQLSQRVEAWRKIVQLSVASGLAVPGMTASLAYFDTYRRERLPANLVQSQRDFFGSHTYQRVDVEGSYHTVWDPKFGSEDSITTSGYSA